MAAAHRSSRRSFCEERLNAKEEHLNILSTACNRMRRNLFLTDVVLICDAQEFSAHRILLAASSPYFNALFTNCMKETLPKKVDIPNIEPKTMNIILDFVYTGNIKPTLDKMELRALLSAAELLQMNVIIKFCCNSLIKCLKDNEFIEVWELANKYVNKVMRKQIVTYIAEHFLQVFASNEFALLPQDLMTAVVKHEAMKRHPREEVLQAIHYWVHYNKIERERLTEGLMEHLNSQDIEATPSADDSPQDLCPSDATTSESLEEEKEHNPFPQQYQIHMTTKTIQATYYYKK